MKRILFRLILFIIFIPALQPVKGSHLMGVDLTYQCVNNCTIRVFLRTYRDCTGSNIITNLINFTGQGANCVAPQPITGWSAQLTTEVTPVCPGITTRCNDPLAQINGVQEFYWYADYDICAANCGTYTISWGTCCRNGAVTSGSGNQGMGISSTTINTTATPCNSSPQFANPPVPYICQGQPFTFNQGATDPDGDSLVYSMGPCYDDLGNQVTYFAGYSPTQPLGSTWNVQMNSQTGDITVLPQPGSPVVGVLCVYVQEYRDGQLINTIVRDIQMTVISCTNNLPSMTGLTNGQGGAINGYTATVCNGIQLCFDLPTVDTDPGDVVTISWNQNIAGGQFYQTGNPLVQDTISGTNPSASFCWTPASPGTYSFLVTVQDDACPVLGRNQYTVVINVTELPINMTATPSGCFTVDLCASSPNNTGPYSYNWNGQGGINTNPGVNNPCITQTFPGAGSYIYTVTMIDANGCFGQDSGLVNVVGIAATIADSGDISCFGAGDGYALSAGGGGAAPYSYVWNTNPPQNGNSISGLGPGTYVVTVTDNQGCTSRDSVTIVEPQQLSLFGMSNPVTCNGGSDGSATALANGGTPTFVYTWNTVPPTNGAILNNVPAGNYTCVVVDANGCTDSTSRTVSSPPPLILTVDSTLPATCNNSGDGQAYVSASGGAAPLTFSWSNGQTGPVASGLNAGAYTVTLTDANGCTDSLVANIITPSLLQVSLDSTRNVGCNGGSDGQAYLSAGGGSQPYTFSWPGGQTGAQLNNLSAGSYTVTLTDANGCTDTTTASVTEPAAIFALPGATTDASCNGATDGTASASASGGNAPYTYAWSNGQSGPNAINLGAGSYIVTVTDASGCNDTTLLTINQPTLLSASISSTQDLTCNGAGDGQISATAQGGIPGYTYSWSNGQSGPALTNLPAGSYTLTVTDANGCTQTTSATVNEPSALQLSTTFSPASCGSANGSATATVSGGAGGYSYYWNSTPAQTTATLSNVPAGNYGVMVTDANGCVDSANVAINNLGSPIAVIDSSFDLACAGDGNGSAFASVTGGTPSYSYSWNTVPPQTTLNATGLSGGNYVLTVTDSNNCVATANVSITEPPALTLVLDSSQDVGCNGGLDGAIFTTGAGGTPGYSSVWNTNPPRTGLDLNGLGSGSYTLTFSDANGCSQTVSTTINEPLAISISTSVNPASCGNADGSATATASGGTGTYSYLWNSLPPQTSSNLSNVSAGSYQVLVTDGNGCIDSASVSVNDLGAPTVVIDSSYDLACAGDGNGAAFATVNGGTGNLSYSWNTNPPQNGLNATGLPGGTFVLTVSDANNCIATGSITILEPPVLQVVGDSTLAVSCHGGANGEAYASASGGTPVYTALWNTTPPQNGLFATGLVAGAYTLLLTDQNGCQDSTTLTVAEPSALVLGTTTVPATCGASDGSATVQATGGTPGYSYSWQDGQNTATASNLFAGQYGVMVTDQNGCLDSTAALVQNLGAPSLTLTDSGDVTCFGDGNGFAQVALSGGTAPFAPVWNTIPPQNGLSASNLGPGSYTLTVTDSAGCIASLLVTVTEPPQLLVNGTADPVTCYGDEDGRVSTSTQGGVPAYTYTWGPAPQGGSDTLLNLASGNYALTVTDANGCSDTLSLNVGTPSQVIAGFVTAPAFPTTVSLDNSTVTLTNTSQNANTYLWSFGDGNFSGDSDPVHTYLEVGEYCIELLAIGENGCADSLEVCAITVNNPQLYIPNTFTPNNDEKNDVFEILGLEDYPDNSIVIYNRWGNKIYEAQPYQNDWQGTDFRSGEPLPDGAYFYVFRPDHTVKEKIKGKTVFAGDVVILR